MQIQPNRLNKKFKYMRHNKELACQITTQKTASGIEMLVLKNPKKDFAVKCSNLATRYLQYDFYPTTTVKINTLYTSTKPTTGHLITIR